MFTARDVVGRRQPDFQNILKVLRREKPSRYTLFEFFLNKNIFQDVLGRPLEYLNEDDSFKYMIETYYALGYDYATLHASNYIFEKSLPVKMIASTSLNESPVITDLESYRKYIWKNPRDVYDGRLQRLEPYLPEGMKFIVYSHGGVLENVISLVGYDNLCFMIYEDPGLAHEIFGQVGTRLAEYYACIIDYDCVGAIISNDDWGFNTQTMLSPGHMREFVIPYHRMIAKIAHDAGKPIILHSCGKLDALYDDIIDGIGYDGKHSYEDNILPVEQAYDKLHERIAVIGGIDLDFVCRSTEDEIFKRSYAMLEKTGGKAYALGTGNSVPEYVPNNNYYAMISAALL